MKNLILIAAIGFFSFAACAQTTDTEKKETKVVVPESVSSAFAKDFPAVSKVSWDMEDGNFEAEFKEGGVDESATYDKTGHKMETEVAIKVTDLPQVVQAYITKNYAAYKLTEAAKITNDKNILVYEAEVGKDGKSYDVIFDADGKFIKQVEGD